MLKWSSTDICNGAERNYKVERFFSHPCTLCVTHTKREVKSAENSVG